MDDRQPDICKKPCRQCQNADYIPLSNSLIIAHFRGKHILRVYPILKDNTCHFIAADFDNHSGDRDPLEDLKSFKEVCEVQDIPVYILRSKSGAGYPVTTYRLKLACYEDWTCIDNGINALYCLWVNWLYKSQEKI